MHTKVSESCPTGNRLGATVTTGVILELTSSSSARAEIAESKHDAITKRTIERCFNNFITSMAFSILSQVKSKVLRHFDNKLIELINLNSEWSQYECCRKSRHITG